MDTLHSKLYALGLPEPIAVVGMGASGTMTLKVLREAGYDAFGADENKAARHVLQCDLDDAGALRAAATMILSPGVDSRKAAIASSHAQKINDIELFALLNDKPVYAVTGSNGKSTVVTLLAECLRHAGKRAVLCGNIGRPVLEALFAEDAEADCYVMELSSYQLEFCPSLSPDVGAVMNVTPDHLDRYGSFIAYADAKANLVRQADISVLNADDAFCRSMANEARQVRWFALGDNHAENRVEQGEFYLHNEAVMPVSALTLQGAPNHANVLAVLVMLDVIGVAPDEVRAVLETFAGLPHRMQLVAEQSGVRYINDSKATNIGAAAAALSGLTAPLHLIAGGVGKGQDFNDFAKVIATSSVRHIFLIGKDNSEMQQAFAKAGLAFEDCGTMDRAVARAREVALSGDIVLLSPATASFDQYSGFAERGQAFAYEVTTTCRPEAPQP
ncbi:MAG: UDP-N-acetylmuramoyl-L-alanine--D-glutamate ligase [Cardiobacteriaceae bacterium]|nr:UDP-N-acetylmuramoyl-L-alanine--D-glutamate ligase [Cardiobacteriaceae bacterium]